MRFLTNAFHLTEKTSRIWHLEGLTLQLLQSNTLRGYLLLQKKARAYHTIVPSNSCFLLQTNWSGLVSFDNGKAPLDIDKEIEVTSWLVSADDFSSRVARGANERVSAANE